MSNILKMSFWSIQSLLIELKAIPTVDSDILNLYEPLPFIIDYKKSKLESFLGGIAKRLMFCSVYQISTS